MLPISRSLVSLVFLLQLWTVLGETWKKLSLSALTTYSVTTVTENEVCLAALDKTKGPLLYYSYNHGVSWKEFPTLGNNAAVAVSGDKRTVCVAGTKSYCVKPNSDNPKLWPLNEIQFDTISRNIGSFGERGFGMVGTFSLSGASKRVNGVAFTSDIEKYDWSFSDVGLDAKQGYYAMYGAFPSRTTWYVTSGSWPISTDQASNMLSGRLYFVPRAFPNYQYEFYSLRRQSVTSYRGAISKTIDGGKTWKKVFDSNNTFYFNQIHCANPSTCTAVGEGSEKTVVLLSTDGGNHWNSSLSLSPDYSLHAVKMISSQSIWVAGGMKVSHHLRGGESVFVGIYYFTIDGGMTWELRTSEGYVYDLTFFENKIGYATTIFDNDAGISQILLE